MSVIVTSLSVRTVADAGSSVLFSMASTIAFVPISTAFMAASSDAAVLLFKVVDIVSISVPKATAGDSNSLNEVSHVRVSEISALAFSISVLLVLSVGSGSYDPPSPREPFIIAMCSFVSSLVALDRSKFLSLLTCEASLTSRADRFFSLGSAPSSSSASKSPSANSSAYLSRVFCKPKLPFS